jgi:ParB family transcriptional regulator, chromosome partitioning protein
MTPRARQINTNLLDSIGLELLKADPAERLADKHLRVETIPAELIRPDPVQPRRVLPEQIHFAFHANHLTPTQALKELIQVAQVAARQSGHPFSSVLELLPQDSDRDGDEQETEAPHLSPEERLVRDLVNLAVTIRDDGQVNPLTVVDVTQGVTRLYRIETGERRYWASWIVRDFLPGYEGDGTIPCIIIPSGKASVFRQAKENTARTGLSAIAMARQAALLILAVHGVEKPEGAVENDFYRRALDLDLRDKREYTTNILSAMGGISKARFRHFKALLRLSDEAMELADRYDVDEGLLRHVLNLPEQDQVEMVRQIITFNLTARQVKEMCEQGEHQDQDAEELPSKEARQFARLIRSISTSSAHDFAQVLLQQEHDVTVARARIQVLKRVIEDTERYLADQ